MTIAALACFSGCESSDAWNRIVYCDQPDQTANTASIRPDGGFVVIGEQRASSWEFLYSWVIMIDEFGQPSEMKAFNSAHPEVILAKALPTSDGGFIATGHCRLEGPGYYLARLDPGFEVVWERCWDIYADDLNISWAVSESADGGVILATHGPDYALAVLRLDGQGNVVQQVTIPDRFIIPAKIIPVADGGYVLVGWPERHCDPVCTDLAWLIKLDSLLNVEWTLFGERMSETVCQTGSGEVVTISMDNDRTTSIDKLTLDGEVIWSRTLPFMDWPPVFLWGAGQLEPVFDCKLFAANNVFRNIAVENIDAAVVKLGDDGIIDWLQSYGGSDHDEAIAVSPGADGRHLVLGTTHFFGGWDNADHFDHYGSEETLWVIRIDGDGNRY